MSLVIIKSENRADKIDMEAVIFCGIQGAGKSTFFQRRFFESHVRINMDMLRSTNPKTGELASATRRRIRRQLELPMKDHYSEYPRLARLLKVTAAS